MPMRIKIPARAAQYVIDLAKNGEATPLQAKLAELKGTDKILVTDDDELVDELRNAMSDLVSDSIVQRKEGDPVAAGQNASAAAKTITHIDQAVERKTSPRASSVPKYDYYELYDASNNLDTAQYKTFAAAIQVARGKKWRTAHWRISGSDGTVLRKYNEQEEVDYRASLPAPKAKAEPKAAVPNEDEGEANTNGSSNGRSGGRGRPAAKKAPAKQTSRGRAKAGANA